MISRCRRFRVKLELLDCSEESVLTICRALRGILEGCDITIESHELAAYSRSKELVMREEWLNYFRILRCKSLEFVGPTEPFFGSAREPLDELIRLVTSNEPVQDTFGMWGSLWTSAFTPGLAEPCYKDFESEMMSISAYELCEYDL